MSFFREVVRGYGGVEYERIIVKARLKEPPKFELSEQVIEYRRDPLLKRWCRINKLRTLREIHITYDVMELFHETKRRCPFCANAIESRTPLLQDGRRLINGRTAAFPNLYPFAPYHLVVIPDMEDHYKAPWNLEIDELRNSIDLCRKFFIETHERDPHARYCSINMNFLYPAGASQPHLHLQVFLDYKPSWLTSFTLSRSRAYKLKFNSNYWDDIVKSEFEIGKRVFYKGDVTTWFAGFAPLCNGEVVGVFEYDKTSVVELEDHEIEGLARDLRRVFELLNSRLKALSLNMVIMDAGFEGKKSRGYFRLHVRVCIRKNPEPHYVNDVGFMELLHLEPVITIVPEELAESLRRN